MKQAVFLIGFGGPTQSEEVRPFLDSVLRGIPIPRERYEGVVHHYELFGGVSPYNAITQRQKKAIEVELKNRGIHLPVFVALRHSSPSMTQALQAAERAKAKRAVAFILAPFRSYSSYEKYIERFEEAKREERSQLPVVYTAPFFDHPLFIEAQSRQCEVLLRHFSEEQKNKTLFIFTAHSIPQTMSDSSGYNDQFKTCSRLITRQLRLENWVVAYQSRSGNPRDPWLVPDVKDFIGTMDRERFRSVFLISPGFLCDNIEVLYDLDTETKALCQELGIQYFRASTVTDEPNFIRLVADLVMQELSCA